MPSSAEDVASGVDGNRRSRAGRSWRTAAIARVGIVLCAQIGREKLELCFSFDSSHSEWRSGESESVRVSWRIWLGAAGALGVWWVLNC